MSHLMVDIDDVLIPTMASIHEIARSRGLHDGSARMAWAGWEAYGCHPEDYWDCWTHFAATGGYVDTPPIPEAAEALRALYWEGHQIHLVTARGFMSHSNDIRAWTPQWVEEHAIPHHTLTFAQDKVAAQDDLGVRFDYAIDDSPKNIRALTADGIRAYLLNHQHNEADDIPADQRVATVTEWATIITKEAA